MIERSSRGLRTYQRSSVQRASSECKLLSLYATHGLQTRASNRPRRGHMFIAFLRTHTFDHIVVAAYIQHPYCKYIIRLGYGVCSLLTYDLHY